jgi:hypothetical protein
MHLLVEIDPRDYTNPYLPVAPSAIDGTGQVSLSLSLSLSPRLPHFEKLYVAHIIFFKFSFDYLLMVNVILLGWSERRATKQCATGIN